jgi:hypothetical protein
MGLFDEVATALARGHSGEPEDVGALLAHAEDLEDALRELLDWAKRHRAGDRTLPPEEWYRIRDHAERLLAGGG